MKTLTGSIIYLSKLEYILIFLFFIMCGFTNSYIIPYKTLFIAIIALIYILNKKIKLQKSLYIYISSFILVFILQKYYYGISEMSNSLQIIFAGWFICSILGERFKYIYFNIIYILCLISILCYLLMIIFNIIPNIDSINIGNYKGFFLWNVRINEIIKGRNCGPFWEPGAFAGYICISQILFFDRLSLLWKIYKKKMIIIFIALLTTVSTQGYVVFFFIYIFYYLSKKLSVSKLLSLVIIIFIGYIVATSIPFIGEKIQEQIGVAKDIESKEGSQNLSRFSTAMMDIYYIIKHPIIGNTTYPQIRYVDHPYVRAAVEYQGGWGTGSGVTDFIATYGLIPFCIWLLYTCRTFKNGFGKKSMVLCLMLILMLGNAECYFLWILYHSFPFIKLYDKKS